MNVRHFLQRSRAGFTLVEILVGATIGSIVSLGVFAFINTGSMLAARNLSVNQSSNSMRTALDRVENLIQQADTMPTLMNTSGTAVAGTGPAAGVRFDRYVGGPVVVNPPSTSVASSSTNLTLVYAQASSPNPSAGDVLRVDGTATTLRPRISTLNSVTTISAGMRSASVSLSASLGTTVTALSVVRAKLVREVAVIVMPAGSGRQLRFYPDVAATTNLNDATKYVVLTDQIATQSADATPFSLTTIQSRSFVSMSLRVRASNFDRRLLGKQSDQFNTFAQVDTFIRPKINP